MSAAALVAAAIAGWTALTALVVTTAAIAVLARRARRGPLTAALIALTLVSLLAAALPSVAAPGPVATVIAAAALVIAVAGGSPVTRAVFDRVSFDEPEGANGGLLAEDGRERLRGGEVVGLLERLAVAGCLVAGFPDLLVVVVAIKGVGRFTELETGAVRERFIIGTLASWIWAAAAAGVALLAR